MNITPVERVNIIPEYDIERINLFIYSNEIRKTILSNLKSYTKLKMLSTN